MGVRYGYLGPQGTYSEEALYTYLGQTAVDAVPYDGIEQVIAAVRREDVTYGLVPLENSIEGTVNLTIDNLAWDAELTITGEVVLPINQNLMVLPGVSKDMIKVVYSHPQALAQCRKYLHQNLPGIQVREVSSTAEAAKIIAAGDREAAAIGNLQAALKYGLKTIDRNIQDCQENRTRFIILSKEQVPVDGQAKTTVVISMTDRPGALYQILKEFALANINLTRIESRPAKTVLGDYLFFIDLLGHRDDPVVKNCLEAIEDMAASFHILGSYPIWKDSAETADAFNEKETISLDRIRQDIDIIDYQIVELLAKRTQLVSTVGKLKNDWHSYRDKGREAEILTRVKKNAVKKGVSTSLVEKIYRVLFDHFVDLQEKQQVK